MYRIVHKVVDTMVLSKTIRELRVNKMIDVISLGRVLGAGQKPDPKADPEPYLKQVGQVQAVQPDSLLYDIPPKVYAIDRSGY